MKKRDIIIIILLLLLFISMLLLYAFDITWFDDGIYNFIISFRCNILDRYFSVVTHLGDTKVIGILTVICLVLFNKKDKTFLLISVGGGTLINVLLKKIICRARPDHIRLIKQGGYSFPSGHSMITVCFYILLMYLIMKKVKNKYLKVISMVMLSIIVITIPISRIYVGVHYPTDVVAGLCLGGIVLILSINCIKVVGGVFDEKSHSKQIVQRLKRL